MNEFPIDAAHVMAPSAYLVLLWLVSNLLTGVAYLYIPICMGRWFRGIPNYGTGFRALARLFQVFIAACGLHHVLMVTAVWEHPVHLVNVIVDVAMMVVSLTTAIFLTLYESMIREAFASMLKHNDEWRDTRPPAE